MKVIISDHSRAKVYHRIGCPHAARIMHKHRMDIPVTRADALGYRKCKCCGNLRGSIRALTVSPEKLGEGRNMDVSYNKKTDILYIRTEIGLWKTFWRGNIGLVLYHLNRFDKNKSTEQLSHAAFHRQGDVPPTAALEKILAYIENHDRAKQIIADDYRKLPQRTRKQRKYYRQAESRNRRQQINRVFAIFADLEKRPHTLIKEKFA